MRIQSQPVLAIMKLATFTAASKQESSASQDVVTCVLVDDSGEIRMVAFGESAKRLQIVEDKRPYVIYSFQVNQLTKQKSLTSASTIL